MPRPPNGETYELLRQVEGLYQLTRCIQERCRDKHWKATLQNVAEILSSLEEEIDKQLFNKGDT